jgi:hypothetical protein
MVPEARLELAHHRWRRILADITGIRILSPENKIAEFSTILAT